MKTLLALPLGIMVIISILGLLGMGAVGTTDDTLYIGGDPRTVTYYDLNGLAKCFVNGTGVDEAGTIYRGLANQATWRNSTGAYALFWDTSGSETVQWGDVGQASKTGVGTIETTFNDANLGLWAMIIGFAIFAGAVGLRLVGSGISEASVNFILISTAYGLLWAVFAVLSYPVISGMEDIGTITWFSLTVVYTIGVLSTIGNQDGGGAEAISKGGE